MGGNAAPLVEGRGGPGQLPRRIRNDIGASPGSAHHRHAAPMMVRHERHVDREATPQIGHRRVRAVRHYPMDPPEDGVLELRRAPAPVPNGGRGGEFRVLRLQEGVEG